jgi:hypothetical protein
MSLSFLDTDDIPLPTVYRMRGFGGVPTLPTPVRFECRDGYFFYATTSGGVTVEARAQGDTAWIDIVASPIDLAPYAPDFNNFEVRLTPAADDDYETHLFVGENP